MKSAISSNMDGPCGHHDKSNKSEKGKYCMISYMQNVKKKKKKNNQQTRAGNPKVIDKETRFLAARHGGGW